jgi:hypothetical protein
MKKRCLLALCLLLLLVFSSCQLHIDTDPWPASPDGLMPENPPAETTLPTQDPVVDLPAVTQTPAPSDGEVQPGYNG